MLIIGIILIALLLLFIAFAFAMAFVMKWILIIGTIVIYGGCFLFFEAVLGEGHEVTAAGLAVMLGTGIVFLLGKYSSFGEENDTGKAPKKKDVLFLELLPLSMIYEWASPVKGGVLLTIEKSPAYSSAWARFFKRKSIGYVITAIVSNEHHEGIDSCRWRAQKISPGLAQQFGDSDRCSLPLEKPPEGQTGLGLASVLSWIKGKTVGFL